VDINTVKAKVERILSELVSETELFTAFGRDSDGDLFVEREYSETTKYYIVVEPVRSFGLPDELTWDELDLPEYQIRLSVFVMGDLKPGLALYKFIADDCNWLSFSRIFLTEAEEKKVDMHMRSIIAADTVDTPELRNALLFLIRDSEVIRNGIPEKVR
jgi:hypothetical protein